MFSQIQLDQAARLLDALRHRGWTIVTAESCTGGLVAALLTSIPGSSDVFDRGFVTYSNTAKTEALGVDPTILAAHGAVSPETAAAMAGGALRASQSHIAISVTGVAGPGGGSREKPVGLVYLATALKTEQAIVRRELFGTLDREDIRLKSVSSALDCIEARL